MERCLCCFQKPKYVYTLTEEDKSMVVDVTKDVITRGGRRAPQRKAAQSVAFAQTQRHLLRKASSGQPSTHGLASQKLHLGGACSTSSARCAASRLAVAAAPGQLETRPDATSSSQVK